MENPADGIDKLPDGNQKAADGIGQAADRMEGSGDGLEMLADGVRRGADGCAQYADGVESRADAPARSLGDLTRRTASFSIGPLTHELPFHVRLKPQSSCLSPICEGKTATH